MIRYIRRAQLDTEKWDRCIQRAGNGLIYAYCFYLDKMARRWDALVLDDYEAIMPLTWNRKWGIRYLYQPFCTAQLGVFGSLPDGVTVADFMAQVPAAFRYIDIDLNAGNAYEGEGLLRRKNYLLDLSLPYDQIQQQYNRLARRKLKLAKEAGLQWREDITPGEVLQLHYQMMEGRAVISREEGARFVDLCNKVDHTIAQCYTTAVVDAKGTVVASEIYMVAAGRVYSLLAGNTPASNETGAFYYLLDRLIQKFAGTGYVFDFEGSDVPGIAFLFESLGGKLTWYPHLTINRLPWPVRWLKA